MEGKEKGKVKERIRNKERKEGSSRIRIRRQKEEGWKTKQKAS